MGTTAVLELAIPDAPPRPLPLVKRSRLKAERESAWRWGCAPAARSRRRRIVGDWWPLVVILLVQAALSLRLVQANSAFNDESLYLWAGHLEWAHWLHGTHIPPFPTYFSGAPVIYPPLGALADSVGGVTGARVLSLCFMLGASTLLWATARRLYGQRAAFFAAGLWVVLGPTQRLGAFATYDAMALCLVALSAWCAMGGRGRREAVRWMLAGACALVLANATKYATALFDPVVVGLALLTGYPPGGKVAKRRAAYLLAVTIAAIIALIEIGRGWYLAGIDQTTLTRQGGRIPMSIVLRSAWDWTAVVIVLSMLAVILSIKTERPAARWLLALLAGSALLVPIEQARIHTYTSLSKHVDFGAWFAVIAVGYLADRAVGWLSGRRLQAAATVIGSLLLAPVALVGTAQANSFFAWPGTANLIPVLRQITRHGGHFLADNTPPLEYYLPRTSWRQWSSVYSITLPSGVRQTEESGAFTPYRERLAAHYFKLVVLSFTDKPQLDHTIAEYLASDPGYRFAGAVSFSNTGATGSYLLWVYRGAR